MWQLRRRPVPCAMSDDPCQGCSCSLVSAFTSTPCSWASPPTLGAYTRRDFFSVIDSFRDVTILKVSLSVGSGRCDTAWVTPDCACSCSYQYGHGKSMWTAKQLFGRRPTSWHHGAQEAERCQRERTSTRTLVDHRSHGIATTILCLENRIRFRSSSA